MYKKDKWDFDITLEPHNGTMVNDTFNDLQELKAMGIANEKARIIFNNTNIIAGIYDNAQQYIATYVAINEGNKQEIINNLPKEGNYWTIAIALDIINDELEKFKHEKFTREEEHNILEAYNNSAEKAGPSK